MRDGALDALDGDLPRNAMRRQRAACQQHQTHHLQIRGLEQRSRLRLCQAGTERPDIDCLARLCMGECHGADYAPRLRSLEALRAP
jgi:hypothetical protein